MANGQTSYAEWLRANKGTVDQVAARVAPPAATPAPAQPAATPAPVTIQVNAGAAQPAPPAAQVKAPEAAPEQPAEAAPAPAAPAGPPPVEAVTMPGKGNLRSQQADIQAARIADQNAIGQSFIRQGDATAAGETRNAEAIGAANEKAAPLAEDAQANAAANNEQSDKYKRYMDEDIEALRKPIIDDRNGWEKAGGILTGIVGAMFQGRGMLGNALSYGMGALESHINKNLEDQLNAKDAAGKSLPHVQKAMDQLAKDSSDQTEIASKLMANQYLMAENTLKKIAAETKVPEIKENAYRLAMGAHGEALKQAENIVESRLKAAARNPKTDWSTWPIATLEAWEASGKLPGAGVQYLDSVRSGKLKNQGAVSEINARDAKAAGETGSLPPPPGLVVANPALYSSTRDVDRSAFAKKQAAVKSFEEKAARLDALLKEHGTEVYGDAATRMNGLRAAMLSDVKDIKTMGTLDKGLMEWGDDFLGDPNSWTTTGGSVRARLDEARRGLRNEVDLSAEAIGLGKGQPAQPPLQRAERVVQVRAPDGSIRPVAASKVPMALQAGGTLVSEEQRQPAPAAMADASNADYEEQARREAGYR